MSSPRAKPVAKPVATPKAEVVEAEESPKEEAGPTNKTFVVTNFSITYDHPTGVQHRWREDDLLVDDGTKMPFEEVARLAAEGCLKLVEAE